MFEPLALLVVAALLGLITGAVAQSKGRSFFLWWLYGTLIFIVALIHVLLISPIGEAAAVRHTGPAPGWPPQSVDIADELAKLAALQEKGVISQSEFDAQKAKLLAR